MFEYIAVIAAALSAAGAMYSVLSFKKKHEEVSRAYAGVLDSYAKLLGESSTSSISDLAKVRQDLQEVVTAVAASLGHLSGKKTHGAIRLLSKENGELNVVTFVRDIESAANREILNAKYPVRSNTSYSYLLGGTDIEREYFLLNDVERMVQGSYYNTQSVKAKDRKIPYRSVLVVPIQGKRKNEPIGFLTFDSKDKSAFSKDSVDLASSASKLVSVALLKVLSSDGSAEFNEYKQNA